MTRLATLAIFACRPAEAEPMPDDLGACVVDGRARPAAQAFIAARLTGALRAPPVRFGEQPR